MKAFLIAGCLVAGTTLTACGGGSDAMPSDAQSSTVGIQSTAPTPTPTPVADLSGKWHSLGTADDDPCFKAEIVDGNITVTICDNANPNYSALYWKGTFQPDESAEVVSTGDVKAMNDSMLGSQDSTKAFTISNGDLTFPFSMMGTTDQIRMAKD